MIICCEGNLLESEAQALVNAVNTVGVMGKGIALQFKNQFPDNFRIYQKACKEGKFSIGQLLITQEAASLFSSPKIVINFPTKTDWRKPSEYQYIESGLKELAKLIEEKNITSIAVPLLGAGNGGLEVSKVQALIEKHLGNLDSTVYLYQLGGQIQQREL